MKSLTSKTPLPKFQRLPSLLKLPPYTDLSALFITGLPPYSNFLQPFPLLSSSSPFPLSYIHTHAKLGMWRRLYSNTRRFGKARRTCALVYM
jgi:hypothetical protein